MLNKSPTPIEESVEYGKNERDAKRPAHVNEKDRKDAISDELNEADIID